jgi:hypothetical protein
MSIINEALKKTEEHLQRNTAKDNPLAPKSFGLKSFLFYILILSAGLLLGNFIFNLLSHMPQSNNFTSSSQSPKIKTTQTPEKNPLPVAQTTNAPSTVALTGQLTEEKKPIPVSFVLNGIFFSDKDGYALVNNQIVRENDYVDGAKVKSISANTVELDNTTGIITLSTNR